MENYKTELLRTIPNLDVAYAASLLGDLYGFNSPIYLPYSISKDYKAKGFNLPQDADHASLPGFNLEVVQDEEADRMSQFGTPVFGSFTIKGGSYKIFDKRTGKLIDKTYPDFEFPVATIVDFDHSKDITLTPTSGGTGTVKEMFGFEDWKINIRGLCVYDSSRASAITAKEQQNMLIQLDNIAAALDILKGKIFLDKGITRLVIRRLNFSPIQGKPNLIPFEIEAISDEDFLIMDV